MTLGLSYTKLIIHFSRDCHRYEDVYGSVTITADPCPEYMHHVHE